MSCAEVSPKERSAPVDARDSNPIVSRCPNKATCLCRHRVLNQFCILVHLSAVYRESRLEVTVRMWHTERHDTDTVRRPADIASPRRLNSYVLVPRCGVERPLGRIVWVQRWRALSMSFAHDQHK